MEDGGEKGSEKGRCEGNWGLVGVLLGLCNKKVGVGEKKVEREEVKAWGLCNRCGRPPDFSCDRCSHWSSL